MDQTRFDQIARRLARHRVSRRAAVAAGGTGLVAALVEGRRASGQQASPEATPQNTTSDGAAVEDILFVQGFAEGTLAPIDGSTEAYTLTLTGGLGATIYFTDRPARAYGSVPTERFLDGLGFSPENPPNAALVMRVGEDENVAIVELTSPAYDPSTGTATYTATALGDFTQDGATLQDAPLAPGSLPAEFGTAHLFVDSCSDQKMTCCVKQCTEDPVGGETCDCGEQLGSLGSIGFCWHFGDICCGPCTNRSHDYWDEQCNQTFAAACQGKRCGAYAFDNHCW